MICVKYSPRIRFERGGRAIQPTGRRPSGSIESKRRDGFCVVCVYVCMCVCVCVCANALASRACSIRSGSARNPSDRLAREFSRAHFQGARILGANVSEICPFPSSPVEDPYFGTLEREENGTPASILIWIFTGNGLKQISLSWRRRDGIHGGKKKGWKETAAYLSKTCTGKGYLTIVPWTVTG